MTQESLHWRDQEISARHRLYGSECPAVDIDFLLCEYNGREAVALIEYKYHVAKVNFDHPNYLALLDLAQNRQRPIPFLIAKYWPDVWAFKVHCMNDASLKYFDQHELLTERQYVERLYAMRNNFVTQSIVTKLNEELPDAYSNG